MTRKDLRRIGVVLAAQLRASAMTAMQYRANFLVSGLVALYWVAWNFLPLWILFDERRAVAGWDFPSALVVTGVFVLVRAVLEGLITPSFEDAISRIRSGTFDYVLLKPLDAMLLVAASKVEPWKALDLVASLGIFAYAFIELGRPPALGHVMLGAVLLVSALVAAFSLWLAAVSLSFWAVRLDNLMHLLASVFDIGRWPISVFRGALRVVFTVVVPIALMTSYPAMALLGHLDARTAAASVAGSALLLAGSRLLWRRAVAAYTSAA